MQEGIDTAGFAPAFPRREHQPFGHARDLALLVLARPSARYQRRDERLFVAEQRLVKSARSDKDSRAAISTLGSPMADILILTPPHRPILIAVISAAAGIQY